MNSKKQRKGNNQADKRRGKAGLDESEDKLQWMKDEASRRGIELAELQKELDDGQNSGSSEGEDDNKEDQQPKPKQVSRHLLLLFSIFIDFWIVGPRYWIIEMHLRI